MPTTAQQPQSPSRTTISMHFLPARPAAPALAEPPAPRFVLDGLNQRTTQEMDWWTDEYSVYVNSLDEMDWDWTDDYLSDCCDVFLNMLVRFLLCSFVHSFIRSFVHSFIRSFVHSFIRSFVHLLILVIDPLEFPSGNYFFLQSLILGKRNGVNSRDLAASNTPRYLYLKV
ncbi:predicted protein [Sclerotinia sclerotiorum 1980 UF-70]|nr:predicted protein [Sclerotinia sclerotiorum 1980 UF-70]EDN95955.1 predicted protein [Sclerotinia sclerotiorum 1980 UF-70]